MERGVGPSSIRPCELEDRAPFISASRAIRAVEISSTIHNEACMRPIRVTPSWPWKRKKGIKLPDAIRLEHQVEKRGPSILPAGFRHSVEISGVIEDHVAYWDPSISSILEIVEDRFNPS